MQIVGRGKHSRTLILVLKLSCNVFQYIVEAVTSFEVSLEAFYYNRLLIDSRAQIVLVYCNL